MRFRRLFFAALLGVLSIIAVGCGGSSSNDGGNTYTVSFYDGTSKIGELSQEVSAGSIILLPNYTKTGYIFNGWRLFDTGSLLTGIYFVESDLTFYGQWTVTSFNVPFDTTSFDSISPATNPVQAVNGTAITLPTPTKASNICSGWFDGASSVSSPYTVTGNVTLRANCVPVTVDKIVTFDTSTFDSITPPTNPIIVSAGTIMLPTPTKAGNTCSGWLDGTTPVSSPYLPTGNVTLKANCVAPTYNVTFDTTTFDSIAPSTNPVSASAGASITLPTPTKTGNTCVGWLEGVAPVSSPYIVMGNVTLKANCVPVATTYNVTFDNTTFDSISPSTNPVSTTAGTSITLPTPTKAAHTCSGWLDGVTPVSSPYTVVANVTLKADCVAIPTYYNVTFDNTTFDSITPSTNPVNAAGGSSITLPTASKAGFDCSAGWFNGATAVSSPYMVVTNVTLRAECVAIPTSYNVTFNTSSFDSISPTTNPVSAVAGTAIALPTATKAGFNCSAGWLDGVNPVTSPYTVNTNVTLTANCTALPPATIYYNVAFDTTTFDSIAPTTNPVIAEAGTAITLPTATKAGNNCTGWLNGSIPVSSPYTVADNVTLKANCVPAGVFRTLTFRPGQAMSAIAPATMIYQAGAICTTNPCTVADGTVMTTTNRPTTDSKDARTRFLYWTDNATFDISENTIDCNDNDFEGACFLGTGKADGFPNAVTLPLTIDKDYTFTAIYGEGC